MTNGQGLHWVAINETTSSSPDTLGQDFGAPGNWYSHSEINSTAGARKFSTDGFDKFALKTVANKISGGSPSPNNGWRVTVWGIMGFGEYLSDTWMNNKVMTLRLFSFAYNRGNDLKTSVESVFTGPGGDKFTSYTQDHSAWASRVFSSTSNYNHAIFSAFSEMRPVSNDTPDADQLYVGASDISSQGDPGGNGGIVQFGGVGFFPELLITFDENQHTAGACNAFYARIS